MIVALWATRLALHTRACWIGHFHDDLVFLYMRFLLPRRRCAVYLQKFMPRTPQSGMARGHREILPTELLARISKCD